MNGVLTKVSSLDAQIKFHIPLSVMQILPEFSQCFRFPHLRGQNNHHHHETFC